MTSKVLVPIDLSDLPTMEKVITAAVMQANFDNSKLIVMTVVPDIIAGLDWRYAIRGETGGSEEFDMREIVADAVKRLNEIVADRVPEGMEVETVARRGTVYEQVLEVAEEMGVDQIVIGAHRPGLSDFLLGRNAAAIVRHAHCSVNVIRH